MVLLDCASLRSRHIWQRKWEGIAAVGLWRLLPARTLVDALVLSEYISTPERFLAYVANHPLVAVWARHAIFRQYKNERELLYQRTI